MMWRKTAAYAVLSWFAAMITVDMTGAPAGLILLVPAGWITYLVARRMRRRIPKTAAQGKTLFKRDDCGAPFWRN